METRVSIPSSQSPISEDEDSFRMKPDYNPVTDHTDMTEGHLLPTFAEKCQEDDDNTLPPAPAALTRYYNVMDDEGIDDVFMPPPSLPPPVSHRALPLATEDSSGAADLSVSDSSVTFTNGAADVMADKPDLNSLEWPHEEELIEEQTDREELIASTVQISNEPLDIVSSSETSTAPSDQDQASMDGILTESRLDPSGRDQQDSTTSDEESDEEPEDIIILSDGSDSDENNMRDKCPNRTTSSEKPQDVMQEMMIESSGESPDVCDLTESVSQLTTCDYDFTQMNKESLEPVENCNQSSKDSVETHSLEPEIQEKEINEDEVRVDARSFNYITTKYEWMRRDSDTSDVQDAQQLPFKDSSRENVTQPMSSSDDRRGSKEQEVEKKRKQSDGSRTIATDIQHGEELLQRLQLLQQQQHPSISQEGVQETTKETRTKHMATDVSGIKLAHLRATGWDLSHEDEKEEETPKTSLLLRDKKRKSEETKLLLSAKPHHHRTSRVEADSSDDEQNDSGVSADLSPINTHELLSSQIPVLSSCHRFSAAETSMEKQIHEVALATQNLQRAGGIYNLADNPDVLEIPFRTCISLDQLPIEDDPGHSERYFTETKMQKEISGDVQQELVLVNQGTVLKGYSKGETLQLKETKMTFEAFQQDNTQGPTRLRKPHTSLLKDPISPSVLERTHSLEMFTLTSHPIPRTHSLRLYQPATSDREASIQNLRSKSPTGATRDKAGRLSPYPKQDKHQRPYKSMDSISTEASATSGKTGSKTKDGNTRKSSPILRQNPFFKLRPALSLQPEVEKDIREAKEREEELRRQRFKLYGETWRNAEEEDASPFKPALADWRKQSRHKLERTWPPPTKKDRLKSEQTQEPKVHRAAGQRSPLWQRWETGLINGQASKEKK
ncbi:uncharacterized protein LOC117528447 isoform X2 [Thalassophryne amazonica]|uniref:uncharacterized protein LOC117528447 isoform X2 n=1 Tax=Thalassophryne amazonica TaxID=390379 RepID=UPI001472438A|nr:uncharacterized protein LOC117528447 isoform X2 [Thalassophryne amazonica]